MKYIIFILTAFVLIFSSCEEDKWLKEEPQDFLSPENSYQTPEQIDQAVIGLYRDFTNAYYERTEYGWHIIGNFIYLYSSELVHTNEANFKNFNETAASWVPESPQIQAMWHYNYKLIADANTVLSRIEGVDFSSESFKNKLAAQARFFRAYAYRTLGILFGGVPITLEEQKAPKRDFERASRDEVWSQCISDLQFAVGNLPEVTEREADGRLTKAAARHLLTELYIITEDYGEAIETATAVINDPNYSLMTERFGSRIDEPGDVYWDLFRRDNQNRSTYGNTESIFVQQFEWQTIGGTSGFTGEGAATGRSYNSLQRMSVPFYWNLRGDSDDKSLFFSHSSQNGGRGVGITIMTDYLLNAIDEDPDDIRNSEHTIIRDMVADNPESSYYGQKIVENNAFENFPNDRGRYWKEWSTKVVPINNFPSEAIIDPETGETNRKASCSFRDSYVMRLAETYLLRAEAYLKNGNPGAAADDINVVRERSNASPVSPGEVDLDYILDERARELYYETFRLLTLMRTNTFQERREKYDPDYNGKFNDFNIPDRNKVWPIPQSEIEKNAEYPLEQNPGY